jgi:hypothetical protein
VERPQPLCEKRKGGFDLKKSEQVREITIADRIILGALQISDGDTERTFTFEELVVSTWKLYKNVFGLRGFEELYPDSAKIHPNVYHGSALVGKGLLRTIDERVLSMTDAGIARALSLKTADVDSKLGLPRKLRTAILDILEHRVFREWLEDPSKPKDFRGAGVFWGISPGTPSKVVRTRIQDVERKLEEILNFLENAGLDHVKEERVGGRILFEKVDVERCLEFHEEMKVRFRNELCLLDPGSTY